MEKVKVVVAVQQGEIRNAVAEVLGNVEYLIFKGEAGSAEEALTLVERSGADVVLIEAALPGDGYRLAEDIAGCCPGTAMVLLERELKEESMRKALFSGARDVVIYPFTPARLVDALYRSYQSEKKIGSARRSQSGNRDKFKRAETFVFYSGKGGVGKTFLATNLAVALAQNEKVRVALVDLDLDFGSAALALDLKPHHTIGDVINEIGNLDRDLMESFLLPHPSGVRLLAAYTQPRIKDLVDASHIELILMVLQGFFDYLIVDLPGRFNSILDPAFKICDTLFLVTTPEIAAIRNLKSCLGALESLNFPGNKIKLLLNKAGLSGEIRPKDIETTLNRKLEGIFPVDHKTVTASLNRGVPVTRLFPRARISSAILEMAGQVCVDGDDARVRPEHEVKRRAGARKAGKYDGF